MGAITPVVVWRGIGAGDLFIAVHGAKIPPRVKEIWTAELRPALVEWQKELEKK